MKKEKNPMGDRPLMPNHEIELRTSTKLFVRLSKKYRTVLKARKDNQINDNDVVEWKSNLKRQIENILYQVGELSMCVREIKNPLREHYISNYKPAIADTMFIKEYDELELPYDKLKNKCFQLIGKLISTKDDEIEL